MASASSPTSAAGGDIHIIANEPNERDETEYREKEAEERIANHIPAGEPVLFLEVTVRDPSEFASELIVTGEERFGYRILRLEGASIANAIARFLLHVRATRSAKLPAAHLFRLDRETR